MVENLHESWKRYNWSPGAVIIVNEISAQQLDMLASFVCDAYCPKGIEINSIPELRWYLFCKHMAESNRIPPTLGTLKQHIQASVWGQASIAQQEFLDPLQNGFCKDANGDLVPHTTDDLPSRWLIVTARETARRKGVAVDHTTFLTLNSVCAAPCAKTTMITTVIQYLTRPHIK